MSILRPRSDRLRMAIPIMIVALVATACGGSAAVTSAPANAESYGDAAPYPAASNAPVEQPGGLSDDGTGQRQGDGSQPLSAPLASDLKVVYTGSLELVVDDLPAALEKAKAAVLATGGYIGASQERNDGDRSVATVTYRIPSTRWDDSVEAIRAIAAKVVGEQTQATEVGDQIVDLEARLRNLRASEQVLVQIAEGTGKVSDLLEVQARISDVRGEIERIDAQRARLEDQAAYGTLVTTFGLEVVQVQQTAKGWNPGDDVDRATATLIGAGQSILSAAIWFGIVWLPVIVLLLVVGAVGVVVGRRLLRRSGLTTPAGPVAGWGPEG